MSSTKSLTILLPNEDWCVDRLGWEFVSKNHNDKFPISVSRQLQNNSADIIWLLAAWCTNNIDFRQIKGKYVVTTIHHITSPEFCTPPKGYPNVKEKFFGTSDELEFKRRDQITSIYHTTNFKTKEHIMYIRERLGLKDPKHIEVIPLWVNDKIWKPLPKVATLRMKWELPADHMLIGSFQRDSEGSDLSPKLEKGADIFADVLEILHHTGKNPYAVLTGWRRDYLMKRFRAAGIGFQPKLIADSPSELISFEDVNELYNCLDYYFVSSRIEGGPLAIAECAAARVPIISHNVGMAPEILHPDVIFNEDLSKINTMWKRAKSLEVLNYNYDHIRPHLISQGGFDPYRKMFEAL